MTIRDLPRIVIDGRMVSEKLGGVGRYVSLIAKGLAEQEKLSFEPVFLSKPGMTSAFSGFEAYEVRTPHLDFKEALTLPAVLYKLKADLYHSTSHASLPGAPCPWIVTIHDLVHLQFGGPLEKIYFQALVKPFLERAKKILAVSEFSRKEILGFLGSVKGISDRVEVVENAIDPHAVSSPLPVEETTARYGVRPGLYFLALTNEGQHKNAAMAVRAFHQMRERFSHTEKYKLLITTRKYADEPGVSAIGTVSGIDALSLLRGSRALLFPSFYEGAGLPPLEAIAQGVPTLVSDIPAHRETLRDVKPSEVTYLPPDHLEAWTFAMRDVAEGKLKIPSLETRMKLLNRFSASRLGREVDRVYRSVLETEKKDLS